LEGGPLALFRPLTERGFQVEFVSHASAILAGDFPDAVTELERVLLGVTIPIAEIIGSGGGETKGTQRLRRALADAGWSKANFVIEKMINGVKKESQSHEVDHVRSFEHGVVALEIEWNNKDPFFDRDLENFKRLHAEGAISVGIVVTRGSSLQDELTRIVQRFATMEGIGEARDLERIGLRPTTRQTDNVAREADRGRTFAEAWARTFVADKYGAATTHWRKLEDRIRRGVGNPCPLVLIGLPAGIVRFEDAEHGRA